MPAFGADKVDGMSETTGLSSVTEGGVTVTSTSESTEQLTEALKPATTETPTETPAVPAEDLSEAAAKLGKKGGEVAAAKRQEAKEAAAETPPDPDEEPDEEQKTEGKKHPRSDPKARISVLVREREEARREAAEHRAERERLAAELARAGKAPEAPKAETGKPKAEDFEDYADFVEALSDWKAGQRLEAYQKETAAQAQAKEYATRIGRAAQTFNGRIEEAAKTDPALKERIGRLASELQPTFLLEQGQRPGPLNTLADEIFISKQAPALMMHFEEHPEDLQRIAELRSPTDVQVEVRLIARGLDGVTAGITSKPTQSKALPPVRPVTGTPHTAESVPGENASYEAHKAYWGAKDRAARR